MFQSWYVTCDMHYILIAPILVKLIYKKPKKGLLALAGCTIASIMIPFTITYLYEHDGVLRVYMSIFEDLAQSYTFTQMYIKTHNRAIPYFLGMAAAYFYLHLKNKNYQFSRVRIFQTKQKLELTYHITILNILSTASNLDSLPHCYVLCSILHLWRLALLHSRQTILSSGERPLCMPSSCILGRKHGICCYWRWQTSVW